MVSAIFLEGLRACKRAREGQAFESEGAERRARQAILEKKKNEFYRYVGKNENRLRRILLDERFFDDRDSSLIRLEGQRVHSKADMDLIEDDEITALAFDKFTRNWLKTSTQEALNIFRNMVGIDDILSNLEVKN